MPPTAFRGAGTSVPVAPLPPIPTNGLLLDLRSENYAITDLGGGFAQGDWPDSSGNGNNFSTGGTLLAHVPTIAPAVFNALPAVTWTRANSFGLICGPGPAPVWYPAGGPFTTIVVQRGGNISLGCFMHVRCSTVASYNYQISGTALPQMVWLANAGRIDSTLAFHDFSAQNAILEWNSTGAPTDPLNVRFQDVPQVTSPGLFSSGVVSFLELGSDEGVYFPDSERLDAGIGRWLTWNRLLTPAEHFNVYLNLGGTYF